MCVSDVDAYALHKYVIFHHIYQVSFNSNFLPYSTSICLGCAFYFEDFYVCLTMKCE